MKKKTPDMPFSMGQERCRSRATWFVGAALLIFFFSCPDVFGRTVELPVTIDFPLLRSMVVQTAFTDDGQAAVLMDEDNGCKQIIVSAPRFSRENDTIRFESKVFVRMGVSLAGYCFFPVQWTGTVVLFQKPVFGENWILAFETTGSELLDENRNPAKVAEIVWDYIKEDVHSWLKQITIDLSRPVGELQGFIQRLFPQETYLTAWQLIDAMEPGSAGITDDALRLGIQTKVAEEQLSDRKEADRIPSTAELSRALHLWEAWDAFLMEMIVSLVDEPLSEEDRLTLLDAMLETRHGFLLAEDQFSLDKDFVRTQFLAAWKTLSPMFRRHLNDNADRSIFDFLAFFTAADALAVLDTIGPSLGVEISRNGLVRLARLVSEEKTATLDYAYTVNPAFRRVLGFGDLPKKAGMSGDIAKCHGGSAPALFYRILERWPFISLAHAKTESFPFQDHQWLAPNTKEETGPYLEKILALLAETAATALEKSKLPEEYHGLYRQIVKATAWQESCFRQFVAGKNGPAALVSYNGTSVGLMQINERVWRGFYEGKKLRENIAYNMTAGCEIVDQYFYRYALRKMAKRQPGIPPEPETLARVVYAMYNGGPGQFHKVLRRHDRKRYWLSDRLFFEKFTWVASDAWERVNDCLIGK